MLLRSQIFAGFLAAGLLVASPVQAGWEVFKPAPIIEKIKKGIAKQEIGASVNLVNAEILDGISTSLRYKLESEPSYVDGYYTRIDKYTMKFKVNPLEMFDDLDTPIGLGLEKGSEIIFARQFKNQKSSLLAMPYTMKNLPLTADKAINNLIPGDFVAFEGKLSVVLSLGHDALQGSFSAGASTHVFISGEFMVHLFRMPDNKMRVKLISMRSEGAGANAGIDLDKDFEIFGLGLLDRRVERWVNITPLDLNAGIRKNNVIMFDYIFDLNDTQAVQAYNSLLHHKVLIKDVKIANPFSSRTDLMNEAISDLTDIEAIALEDAGMSQESRRIDRVFKGSTEGMVRDGRIKFGLSFFKFQAGRAYSQNKVINYNKEDQQEKFLLDTFSKYKKTKILYGLYGEETLFNSNLMFTADDNFNPTRFVTLTTSSQMKMKDVSRKDFEEIQRLVKSTIGDIEYSKIPWHQWSFKDGKVVNGYFKQEVFFNPEALKLLPYLSREALASRFEQYIKLKGRPRSLPVFGGNSPKDYFLNWTAAFTGDIRRVSVRLSTIINPASTVEDRFEAFEELHQMPIWRERGTGFLMSLLPANQRSQLLRYELILSGKKMPQIDFAFGKFDEEKLYRSLMYIQNVINNRSFDLRNYTEQQQAPVEISTKASPLM